MQVPVKVILLFALGLICASCATSPRIQPGLFETVPSWQYQYYRQYSDSYDCIGMGVSLQLNADSTYTYSTIQMNAKGTWSGGRKKIFLHCDSLELKRDLPLNEYFDKNLWVCPLQETEFTVRNKILYRSFETHEGESTIMIMERVLPHHSVVKADDH